ncbi:hypothetical protein PMIN01_09880 [Paraphaeosphaeria minitans]|uniref:Uncharacterized protein n=1 Tax=Paraphaeosphaeria minitans TaxID=565426 RepID=A0A9P6KMQ7_9PLEO|nr:hypothetical protein PMIN01_09880 [Paraphaeosphaeria minitans]
MFFRPLACAYLLLAAATAQDTTPGFVTIQTSVPSSLATDGESTSACLEVCVIEPCTQCPLTNPLRTTETIPQLTFCNGVYTNTPCASATGQMSIPQGETPEPTSNVSTSAPSEESSSSAPRGSSRTGSVIATSSASGSVPESTSSETPGAAASVFKHDGNFVWVAALSGLSATLGFAGTLL